MAPSVRCRNCTQRRCILSSLEEEDLYIFSAGIDWNAYPKRAVLVERHSTIGCYILCRGLAKLYLEQYPSKRLLIKILEPGDVIVVEALARKTWYNICVQALEEVEVRCIRSPEFHVLLERHAPLKDWLLQWLSTEHLELQRAMMRMSPYFGVRERLARLLLDLSQDDRLAVSRGGGGRLIDVELSEKELAELIASHRVTVTKQLSDFVARGWIRHVGRSIEITNEEALRDLIVDLR